MLEFFEKCGKAFGWLGTIFSAITAFFAFIVAVEALRINQDNIIFQKQFISIQSVQRMLADYTNKEQINGLACVKVLLSLPDNNETVIKFIGSVGSNLGTEYVSEFYPCLRKEIDWRHVNDSEDNKNDFRRYVKGQIFNHINSMEPVVWMIGVNDNDGVGDRKILCDTFKGINDSPIGKFMGLVEEKTPLAGSYPRLFSLTHHGAVAKICEDTDNNGADQEWWWSKP